MLVNVLRAKQMPVNVASDSSRTVDVRLIGGETSWTNVTSARNTLRFIITETLQLMETDAFLSRKCTLHYTEYIGEQSCTVGKALAFQVCGQGSRVEFVGYVLFRKGFLQLSGFPELRWLGQESQPMKTNSIKLQRDIHIRTIIGNVIVNISIIKYATKCKNIETLVQFKDLHRNIVTNIGNKTIPNQKC